MIVYTKKNLIMFNGIVFNTGKIKLIKKEKNSTYIAVKTNLKFSSKDLGSSVSCNGACLTLTKIKDSLIIFYISKETLIRTNFNTIKFNCNNVEIILF